MKIVVSGAGGLVGSALLPELDAAGHEVVRLVRRAPGAADEISWDPAAGRLDAADLAGVDAVVHLAGENLAAGRWTAAKKERIRESRVRGTRLVAEILAGIRSGDGPRTLVAASAIGYYGERGDAVVDEDTPSGEGFLADVCVRWEAAAEAARQAGLRVVHLRIGMVLAPRDGALGSMLPAFRLGLGGKVGSGRQWWSWITAEDLAGAVRWALEHGDVAGPVNAVAPHPVTQAEFARTLGHVLRRPALAPLPAFAARALLGEMAGELLLTSTRVRPRRLCGAAGHSFRHPELAESVQTLLKA